MIVWTTGHARVFAINHRDDWEPGTPEYMSVVGIDGIDWDAEVRIICHHCGACMDNGSACLGCGSRSPGRSEYSMGSAVAHIRGRMPQSACIFWLKDGAIFDLAIAACGDPSEYRRPDIKFRLMGCKTIRKSIPAMTAFSCNEIATIDLYLDVSCEVEFYPNGLP